MQPGYSRILVCPKCNGTKSVLNLISGNTFSATYWSDCKNFYPMLPEVSPIQKCQHCGTYYFIHEQRERYSKDDYSMDLGLLKFTECKEAIEQFLHNGINKKNEFILRLLVLHRYNDIYYRQNTDESNGLKTPDEEDTIFFKNNIIYLLKLLKNDKKRLLLRAELLREIGQFDDCIILLTNSENWTSKLIQKIKGKNKDENKNDTWENHVRTEILTNARNKNNIVFKL